MQWRGDKDMLRFGEWLFNPRYYHEEDVECMVSQRGREIKVTLYNNGLLWAEGKIPSEIKGAIKTWWAKQKR